MTLNDVMQFVIFCNILYGRVPAPKDIIKIFEKKYVFTNSVTYPKF